jgi:hypothetical protein
MAASAVCSKFPQTQSHLFDCLLHAPSLPPTTHCTNYIIHKTLSCLSPFSLRAGPGRMQDGLYIGHQHGIQRVLLWHRAHYQRCCECVYALGKKPGIDPGAASAAPWRHFNYYSLPERREKWKPSKYLMGKRQKGLHRRACFFFAECWKNAECVFHSVWARCESVQEHFNIFIDLRTRRAPKNIRHADRERGNVLRAAESPWTTAQHMHIDWSGAVRRVCVAH